MFSKSILFSTIIFFTAVLFTLLIHFFPRKSSPWSYAMIQFSQKIIEGKHNEKIDHLFIGDSFISSAIIPKKIPNSIVLGIADASTVDIYYLIEKFIKNNKNTKSIFIQVPYVFAFYRTDFYEKLKYQLISCKESLDIFHTNKNLKAWDLPRRYIHSYAKIAAICLKWPFFYGSMIRRFFFYPDAQEKTQSILDSLVAKKGSLDISKVYNYLNKEKREILLKRKREFSGYFYSKSFYKSPLQIFYLRETVSLLNNNNIKVYFISTIYDYKKISRTEYNLFLKEMNTNNPIFESKKITSEDFVDINHLNRKGALKYTLEFLNFIKSNSIKL